MRGLRGPLSTGFGLVEGGEGDPGPLPQVRRENCRSSPRVSSSHLCGRRGPDRCGGPLGRAEGEGIACSGRSHGCEGRYPGSPPARARTNPRSQVVRKALYEKTLIRRGASIGANATVVCGITIGRYAFIAAGAVIAKDVPDYALMIGVPARHTGWMSRHGHVLKAPDLEGIYTCPESGLRYKVVDQGILRCLDLDEDASLPEALATGKVFYRDLKKETGKGS